MTFQIDRRGLMIATGTLIAAPYVTQARAQSRALRFAFQNVADHPQGLGAKRFAELLGERTSGRLNVRLFAGGQLGGDLPTVSALQGGTIDFTVLNAGLLVGLDKQFAALDLPFLFNTPQEADRVVDGAVGQRLAKGIEDKGLVGLGYWELGFRNVTNSRRPITKLEDFRGLKLRVLQSPLFIDLFNALGANAVPMPWPEVYPALEQKVVDGQENPFPTILGAKLNEVQRYVSSTRHIYNAQSLLISKRTWDSLSEADRAAVQAVAAEARTFQRQKSRESMDAALQALVRGGMTHNEVAPAEMARIREAVQPVVARYAKEVGEALYTEIQAEISRARA
jgi:tripartite ATP-independent transporter DctP family solute receptor